jgi:protein phosphatase
MVAAGTITEEQARRANLDTVLMNALGIEDDVMVDVVHRTLEPADRLLLCSDGLSDHFTAEELGSRLGAGPPEDALMQLVVGANQRGGHDNITGVVVEIAHWRANPLASISDDMLAWFVERSIHEESGPII